MWCLFKLLYVVGFECISLVCLFKFQISRVIQLLYVVSQCSYFMWCLFGLSHDHNIVSHDHKKLHKSVQVHLLYYVVGAECISLYLGPTKIQQSRLVVFIAFWIPYNPGLVAPSMHATSAPTTVCTLA